MTDGPFPSRVVSQQTDKRGFRSGSRIRSNHQDPSMVPDLHFTLFLVREMSTRLINHALRVMRMRMSLHIVITIIAISIYILGERSSVFYRSVCYNRKK